MLVLSRKPKETIQIGDDITVTILNFKGGAVRIGIDAPKEVKIKRGPSHEHPRENLSDIAGARDYMPCCVDGNIQRRP